MASWSESESEAEGVSSRKDFAGSMFLISVIACSRGFSSDVGGGLSLPSGSSLSLSAPPGVEGRPNKISCTSTHPVASTCSPELS